MSAEQAITILTNKTNISREALEQFAASGDVAREMLIKLALESQGFTSTADKM